MPSTVKVNPNGSISIEGDFILVDGNDQQYNLGGRTKVFLCRCGESSNKPFCDGTHKTCGFVDPGTARELAPKQ